MFQARVGLISILCCLVAACGGGGSQPPASPPVAEQPPPAATPTQDELTSARGSQVKMTLRSDTQQLTISWIDQFTNETAYRVEVREANGTWRTVESLPAGAATGDAHQWQRIIDVSNTYRVSAVLPNYALPLATDAGQSELAVEIANVSMAIEFDQTLPVHGTVQLRLADAVGVESVGYYVDLNAVGNGSTGPQFAANWNSTTVPDGEHLVIALVRQTSGVIVELRRQVVTDNPNVAIGLAVDVNRFMANTLNIAVTATADVGIRSVEFFVNGVSERTVTVDAQGRYAYTLSTLGLPGGTNVFKAVATSNAGETAEATREWLVDNPPTLSLTVPHDGIIVTGNTLHVEGTFADDFPGASLRVTLGSVPLLETTRTGGFSVDYSLAGLPPGEYTLLAQVHDKDARQARTRRAIIVPSGQFTYELVTTDTHRLLATAQGAVVYRKATGDLVLRRTNGADVTLQVPANVTLDTEWQLDHEHAVVTGRAPGQNSHIYVFDATGRATNLSAPLGLQWNDHPVLKYPWLIWNTGSDGQFEIHNLATQARITLPRPVGTRSIGNNSYDFVTTPGAEQFVFWANSPSASPDGVYDIFVYDLASDVTRKVTGSSSNNYYPQTDNVRFAWHSITGPQTSEVVVAPVANPTATTALIPSGAWFKLRDGQLVWSESNGAGGDVLKVNDGTTTTVITSLASRGFPSVSDGRVTFLESGKVMVWTAGGGKRELLNVLPTQAPIHDQGVGFFLTGYDSMSIYRVQLP